MNATVTVRDRALEILAREQASVDAALARALEDRAAALGDLAEPIRYAVLAPGKRLRPILCITAFRALSGSQHAAVYDAACAIEIIHTYSLVHDDLPCMDDDDLRRGRPTTHKVFGESRAMLAGAAMIPLACTVLSRAAASLGLSRKDRAAAVLDLTSAAGANGMIAGQALDLAAEGQALTAGELEAIHLRKTGALFGASLRLGGRLAGAAAPVLDALTRSGRALGLAFQVTDDLLDVTGQASVLGKTAGRDEQHGKATYPALLGVRGARAHAAAARNNALEALRQQGIRDESLEALIGFAIERDR